MKKVSLILLSLAALPSVYARHISPGEADEIANRYLTAGAARTASLQRAAVRGAAVGKNAPFYVYNRSNGGFVIVSGDDRFGSILAYSDRGVIDPAQTPQGLDALLGMYAAAYNALDSDNAQGSVVETDVPAPVVSPLLGDIQWGQDVPFNTLTPKMADGKNYYTGCVACAATMIMRHYSYPARGNGSATYTDPMSKNTLTADFGSTEYAWADMPAVVPANVTAQQTTAYSTLAAHFGIAVQMQYEASGSGTYDMLVPYALRNYFGYDAAVRSHQRNYYSTSEWMQLIKDELQAGRPVFYGGSSDSGQGGHAFVIDGYDTQNLVHVNWGWTGKSNGYFRINHLDPTTLGIGAGAGGYNLSQDMVTGIQPAKAGSARDYAVYGETRFSLDGPYDGQFTAMTYLGNQDVEPFEGRVEGALVRDGRVVATLGGADVSLGGFATGHPGSQLITMRNIAASVAGVADGDYVLRLAYRGKDESEWHVLRHPNGLPSYANVTVSGGTISLRSAHVPGPAAVLHSSIATDGNVYAGGYGRATFSMESTDPSYDITKITLRLTKADDPTVKYDSDIDVRVYNQSVETVDALFAVNMSAPLGVYNLEALVKVGGKEYPVLANGHAVTQVNVLAAPAAPVVRMVGAPVWQVNNATAAVADRLAQGEYLYVTALMRNAGVAGKARVLARLTNTATGVTSPMIMTEATFTSEKAQTVTFARQMPHDPGTYTVDFVQIADDYAMTPIAVDGEQLTITVDPASNLVGEVVSLDFPDRLERGVSQPYSITVKGLATATNTLYIRVRQLTNTKGEIVNMKSGVKFAPDAEVTVSGNYRPGTSLEDALYLLIVEAGPSSAKTLPLANHAAYSKLVALGNVAGVSDIVSPERTAAVWLEGTTLRIATPVGTDVKAVQVYSTTGSLMSTDTNLSALTRGHYIAVVTLSDGTRTTAKIHLP